MSMLSSVLEVLLCLRWRFGATDTLGRWVAGAAAPGPGVALSGAAAIGITPFPPLIFAAPAEEPTEPWYEVGVLPAVLAPLPADPVKEGGLWLSLPLRARTLVGVVACVTGAMAEMATMEFFLVFGPLDEPVTIFFEALVEVPPELPTGSVLPEPRLRFLMTSVLSDRGRTTPWSFRKSPQALHRGWPSGFRRQRGVVCVKQLVHVV